MHIVCLCVCVCLSVSLSVWYVILEREDKNVRAELMESSDNNNKDTHSYFQSKFSFHMRRSFKHTILYTCGV